jgi:hypothetical protein
VQVKTGDFLALAYLDTFTVGLCVKLVLVRWKALDGFSGGNARFACVAPSASRDCIRHRDYLGQAGSLSTTAGRSEWNEVSFAKVPHYDNGNNQK